ncbi:histidine kinase dimerization/phospho-acceptor domain-containing protein [Streptomyces sp. NPDC051956]|uniref:histidine kinase dimerization/phospho-acceptor domain-containing protein n=1 Tax=Streptomyces sp. NPDC051956 TaxID=3365677 RepID=UPI0037D3BC56
MRPLPARRLPSSGRRRAITTGQRPQTHTRLHPELARLVRHLNHAAHQRFAANASHELLTPLATTRAALQVAGDDSTGEAFAELAPRCCGRPTNATSVSYARCSTWQALTTPPSTRIR